WGDPEVTKWIDVRGCLSPDDVNERLEREIDSQRRHEVQYWPIFLLENDDHVGCCGLQPYDLPTRVYELGAHIRPAYWRRGLAKEAAGVIEYAFNTLGASGLFAGHNPNNMASRGLLTALGFRYTHDELYPPTGLLHPSYFLARPLVRRRHP
ncbi:MAG TPA: GNAT family N-acetyltransferase, partial [Thermoanaerobaculia bacterium]|nr:GNAT family N-acetyltransferase [Thermoanaerobaculia bacterium]